MSTPKTSEAQIEEMDLLDIFSLFKRWFYGFLALCFRAVDFMLKYWWMLLLLAGIGFALGKFFESKPKYKSTLIIKTNFDSQPYVYNAIKQFDDKVSEKDETFIRERGLNLEEPEIGSVEILPIVDVVGLLEDIGNTDSRNLSAIIKELSVDDEVELFASDRFYSNYKYHQLEIYLRTPESKTAIDELIRYINNQPQIVIIKEGVTKNLDERIVANEALLAQIDTLISSYTQTMRMVGETSDKLSFFNNQNNLNVNGALALKNNVLSETEELKNDYITYSDAAVVISDIQTVKDERISDKKHILYPLLLIFVFLALAATRYCYRTLRSILVKENLLD